MNNGVFKTIFLLYGSQMMRTLWDDLKNHFSTRPSEEANIFVSKVVIDKEGGLKQEMRPLLLLCW